MPAICHNTVCHSLGRKLQARSDLLGNAHFSSLLLHSRETLYTYPLRVDYGVVNEKRCRDFFLESKPRQSKAPVSAYRWAFRKVLSDIIKKENVPTSIKSISVRCNDPPRHIRSGMKRITAIASFKPLPPGEWCYLASYYSLTEEKGNFTAELRAKGGEDFGWDAAYFEYRTIRVGGQLVQFNPICGVGDDACATTPWNPRTTYITKLKFQEN
jgi:hypothetical protein